MRYELKKGTSNKFWEIAVDRASLTTKWGRIGSAGQSKTKAFPDPAKAKKEHDRLIASKLKEGYQPAGTAKGAASKKPAGKQDPKLLEAAKSGDAAKVKKLLAAGADPESGSAIGGGATALLWACSGGHEAVVALLLAAGASPNHTVENGTSPFSMAAARGHKKIVERLIAAGADITGAVGKRAFEKAAKHGRTDVVALLGRARSAGGAKGAPGGDAAKKFRDTFAFLAATPAEKDLLEALSWRVTSVKPSRGGLTVKIGDEVIECDPPSKAKAPSWVPKSFAAIASRFNGIRWESAGGGSIGFGGFGARGTLNDWGWDSSYLREGSNKKLFTALAKAKTGVEELSPAFGCAQNWLLFDPTRKSSAGELALAFVSHESCEWEPVKSADKLGYGGVLLRLMARYFADADVLDEVSL